MSVLVIGKVQGDTAKFRQALAERGEEFAKFVGISRASGAIHHRFGIGDGFVVFQDEWESAEQFQRFFADPSLQAFIATIGAEAPPELIVSEAVNSSDEF
jgi:quinol monooxygenase YgiN